MARPPHEPTDETQQQVSTLAAFGIPQDEIAAFLGISKPTLAKHYRDALNVAAIKAKAEVGQYLLSLATGRAAKLEDNPASHADCVRVAIFFSKTRMGLRETNRTEHTSPDGTMTPTTIIIKAADGPGGD